MNDPQRAQQIWSVLVERAREQKVIGYQTLDKVTGLVARGSGDALGDVCYYCLQNKLPLLNMLAISEKDGEPSANFLKEIAGDLAAEHRKIFALDWSEVKAPTEVELTAARQWYEARHPRAANPTVR